MALQAHRPIQTREEQIARAEDRSRSLNERRAVWVVDGREAMAGFRCECWQENCAERIPLTGEQWAMVRAQPNRFAVAPGHVARKFEAVVQEFADFWTVEKFGRAGEIAERLAADSSSV